jgi:hypothetical protein
MVQIFNQIISRKCTILKPRRSVGNSIEGYNQEWGYRAATSPKSKFEKNNFVTHDDVKGFT